MVTDASSMGDSAVSPDDFFCLILVVVPKCLISIQALHIMGQNIATVYVCGDY
jgi:hypothetical protein